MTGTNGRPHSAFFDLLFEEKGSTLCGGNVGLHFQRLSPVIKIMKAYCSL